MPALSNPHVSGRTIDAVEVLRLRKAGGRPRDPVTGVYVEGEALAGVVPDKRLGRVWIGSVLCPNDRIRGPAEQDLAGLEVAVRQPAAENLEQLDHERIRLIVEDDLDFPVAVAALDLLDVR